MLRTLALTCPARGADAPLRTGERRLDVATSRGTAPQERRLEVEVRVRAAGAWYVLVAALALGGVAARDLHAQPALELRLGASMGHYEGAYGQVDVAPRPAGRLSLATALGGLPVQAIAGYERSAFGCVTGFCRDAGVSFVSSGPFVGARVVMPGTAGALWLQADAGAYTLRADWGTTESGSSRSGWSAGWGLGAGAAFPLAAGVRLTPGLRAQRYRAAFDDAAQRYHVFVGAAELAVRFTF
jgi:hypothetical protein